MDARHGRVGGEDQPQEWDLSEHEHDEVERDHKRDVSGRRVVSGCDVLESDDVRGTRQVDREGGNEDDRSRAASQKAL